MGLLTRGTLLTWEETKAQAENLRHHAIKQFIYKWPLIKDLIADNTKWGDEIECTLVKFDHEHKVVNALLSAEDVLKQIEADPSLVSEAWHPEFAGYMLEGVPTDPYNGIADCAELVEEKFRTRRIEINRLLKPDETIMTIGTFPLTGCPQFTYPPHTPDPQNSASGSIMFPDKAIFGDHPHFIGTTKGITGHRGEKPPVLLPIFRDENTPKPFRDDLSGHTPTDSDKENMKEDHIYMDGVPFGPSCCSLQMTTQCDSFAQAMHLRDQFIPLCPILLALSASTPIFRGILADCDTRWSALRQSLDDRSPEERGETTLLKGEFSVPCSRNDALDNYVTERLLSLNDIPLPYCVEAYNAFLKADVDPNFATDLAHMMIRGPLQMFDGQMDVDDKETSECFEDIHLFHWRSVRVKLPPRDGSSGWKVEFRPTEPQATDFQNAALTVFIFLLSRIIFQKNTEFAIPISKVFSNMSAANERDAARKGKFWWRASVEADSADDFVELSIDEIINGKPDSDMPGLAPLVEKYIDEQETISNEQKQKLLSYVALIRRRANGSSKTNAQWMRDFVQSHPNYRKDSIVPENVIYEMLKIVDDVNFGRTSCPDLVG
uniref:Glutamate--cysteine ligase n=1 Tax=Plectus sambesii TaxID=2011161 RepID=A0A914V0J1_9BILA